MNENLAKFTAALAANPALKAKVESLQTADPRDAVKQIVAISVEAGTPVSASDLATMGGELTEEQLEAVSGGMNPWDPEFREIAGPDWIEKAWGDAFRGMIGNIPPVPGSTRWN